MELLQELLDLNAKVKLTALYEAMDDNQLLQRFCDAARRYASEKNGVASELTTLMNATVKRFPEVRYSGRMFRGITVAPELMYESPNPASLMKKIAAKSQSVAPGGLCSWSESVEGVMSYIHTAVSYGYRFNQYDDTVAKERTNKHKVQCIVIYEQVGQGISFSAIEKLVNDRGMADQFRPQMDMLKMTAGVQEVMAFTGTPKLGLLIVEGLGAKGKATADDKFYDEMSNNAKERGDAASELKYRQLTDTHTQRRENFKPEQYQQAVQLMKGYDEDEPVVPRAKKGDEIRGARVNSKYSPEFVATTSNDHQFDIVRKRLRGY